MKFKAKPLRSVLYVPGNKEDWMRKASKYGADALILDLEDSVPVPEKAPTRILVRKMLEELGADLKDCEHVYRRLATMHPNPHNRWHIPDILFKQQRLVVEFSGAATVAALRSGRVETEGRGVVAVVSGGNVDPAVLMDL